MQFSILSSLRAAASCVNSRARVGVGFHEDPQVCHYGKLGTGAVMKPGMIFTIEPMINCRKERTSHPSERLDRRNQR